ncbi:MAG TPA: hypothetical protein VHO24_12030 [Opitutaceae bacterium]|nr:hypothetical protein [Opitutaceae bacterium]
MKTTHLAVLIGLMALADTGCGPSKAERETKERERLELEEQAHSEAAVANKAITTMTEKAFRGRTTEEEAKHKAEVARQVEALRKARQEAEAKAMQSGQKS